MAVGRKARQRSWEDARSVDGADDRRSSMQAKCAHYIDRGAQLENDLGIPGSFTNRPHHIFGVVSELLPSALIYPASFAGWLFLALYQAGPGVRSAVTVAVLVVGAAASMKTIEVMEKTRPRRRAELERRGTLARRQHESAGG